MSRKFENFRSYHLAKELYWECAKIKAKHYIQDQLGRASLSVALNLAEGSGKISSKDKARFYQIALGSLREVYAILDLLDKKELKEKASTMGAHIWKLIQNPG